MVKSKSAYSTPTKLGKMDTHIIVVWVDNEASVLSRVVGLFSGRGYNIESLAVAEVDQKNNLSRITIVANPSKIKKALIACKKYNPVILDQTNKSAVIQITALRREIDKVTKSLKPFGLVSASRTGAVAMTRGAEIFN